MCATLSVICVYLRSYFCPKLYILWGLACTVQNMSGMSPGVGQCLGPRPHRVLGVGQVCTVWGARVIRQTSHCGWACLHIFKGICMSVSQCVPGPMGPWVYLMPPRAQPSWSPTVPTAQACIWAEKSSQLQDGPSVWAGLDLPP